MTLSRSGALASGLLLSALPFFQSGLGEGLLAGAAPHMDHEAHHGGSLMMLGDHHLEFVDTGATLELYVSDAERRPLKPLAAEVRFDDRESLPFEWKSYRHVIARPRDYREAEYRIALDGIAPLSVRVPAGGVSMQASQSADAR